MTRPNKSARRRRRMLLKLAEAQNNQCFHCQDLMLLPDLDTLYRTDERNDERVASYDHLLPKSKGGRGGFNLVIAHRGCNSKRGQEIPTGDEIARLDALNENRKHFFSATRGHISPGSFGEITSSSIVLAKVLNALDGPAANKQRFLVCKFLNAFYQDVRVVDLVTVNKDWFRISSIIKDYYMKRLFSEGCRITEKNFVANVVHSIIKNRATKRRCASPKMA
jgi:hypothetical protein